MYKNSRGFLFAAVAALALSACGGGSVGEDGGTDPTTPVPAQLTLLASSPQLASDASAVTQGVSLIAIVKDNNNNAMAGVTVVFSTPDSGEIVVTNPAVTDDTGRVTAVLTTGGDPQNRIIDVSASVTGTSLRQTVSIGVVGTQLNVTGASSTQINTDTPYTVSLVDAAGDGISGQRVDVTTNAGNTVTPSSFVTNAAGQGVVMLRGTQAATRLTVTSLGLTQTVNVAVSTDQFRFVAPPAGAQVTEGSEVNIGPSRTLAVQWLTGAAGNPVANQPVEFRATHATLSATTVMTNASGIATVQVSSLQAGPTTVVASSTVLTRPSATLNFEFVATTPASISVQGVPANVSVNQTSEINATVFDANNNLVKNQTVDFTLNDITGGVLSSPSAVTNSQGIARITYTASSQTSAADGVVVTGRVRGTGIQGQARLTVGARAVSIQFGTGAELIVKDVSTYQMPWTVIVQDSSGNPVSDAVFTLAIQPIEYTKGLRADAFAGTATECVSEDAQPQFAGRGWNFNDILDSLDINGNGAIDPGETEDNNGNGSLTPGRPASVPRTVALQTDGTGRFDVTYPKEFGYFVRVRLIGTVRVNGTETRQTRDFDLAATENDFDNLPSESPYGTSNSCFDAN
ncbi:hypothetical protein D0B54_06975 [Solimonas sp. K1W22B-7]|uniref:Ig-like domain-containing protein n=1 Tax=Solimonas sp. K1W22B-7 TaxID=2303331 RepID=UPI000E32DD86|nr:Ig-like domain-containing protein [Solimonas sp. K1W22B-7]AXQ28439.1 hypothetical protein D0B54_06975 [Solimonas sp. K1W22B-7]